MPRPLAPALALVVCLALPAAAQQLTVCSYNVDSGDADPMRAAGAR